MQISEKICKAMGKFQLRIIRAFILVLISAILSIFTSLWIMPFDHGISQAATSIHTPLSTQRTQIVDAKGRAMKLHGINWFGMEIQTHTPNGLWVRDYKEMLAQIKSLGYNLIRLPYSVEALRSHEISGVDFKIGANKDFLGKTPLEVMDLVIQEAQRQGLLILLDSHCLKDGRISELWYGDGLTEKDWIDTWILLAKRYKNYTNVIGADLKNEPHGLASWGTNDNATDWRLAAQRAGNQILRVNHNWLILVEGVEKNVPNQKLSGYVWGGNLEGAGKFPVHLKLKHKLVYSPHEYGSSDMSWFSEPTFPNNLYQRWEIGFYYIVNRGLAPIFIGEFGGYSVDNNSKEGIWQRQFVDYISKKKLNFAYWCWNPNSKGTGGILLDDWHNINYSKQALLSKIIQKKSTSLRSLWWSLSYSNPK
jgi:endoglucanase